MMTPPSNADHQSTTITIGSSLPDRTASDSSSASLLDDSSSSSNNNSSPNGHHRNSENDFQQHRHQHLPHRQHPYAGGHIITTDAQQQHQSSMVRLVERNYQYLQSQIGQLIRARLQNSHTFFTPGICGTITLLYLLNLLCSRGGNAAGGAGDGGPSSSLTHVPSSFISTMLTLSPGNILAPNYWLFSCISTLTYPFVEFHWWQVLTDILVVSLCTTLIEPLWGRKELILFFFVVNLSVAFCTIVHYIFLYSMYGLSGYCAAVLVVIKQILPESVLLATSIGKLKNTHVPICGLLVSYAFYLAGFIDGCLTLMFLYGLLSSWSYLRFVQFHPSNGLRGDLSPSFDFATFFPALLKPFVSVVANSCYTFFVRLRLLSPASHRQYQNLRVLSERLSQEHSGVIVAKHFKHHQSGDYQHLHNSQPRVENM